MIRSSAILIAGLFALALAACSADGMPTSGPGSMRARAGGSVTTYFSVGGGATAP